MSEAKGESENPYPCLPGELSAYHEVRGLPELAVSGLVRQEPIQAPRGKEGEGMKKIVDLGDAVAIIKRRDEKIPSSVFTYITFMNPSYLDEHVYAPAESVHIALSQDQLKTLRDAINEFLDK